jgi:hypothetical protein
LAPTVHTIVAFASFRGSFQSSGASIKSMNDDTCHHCIRTYSIVYLLTLLSFVTSSLIRCLF